MDSSSPSAAAADDLYKAYIAVPPANFWLFNSGGHVKVITRSSSSTSHNSAAAAADIVLRASMVLPTKKVAEKMYPSNPGAVKYVETDPIHFPENLPVQHVHNVIKSTLAPLFVGLLGYDPSIYTIELTPFFYAVADDNDSSSTAAAAAAIRYIFIVSKGEEGCCYEINTAQQHYQCKLLLCSQATDRKGGGREEENKVDDEDDSAIPPSPQQQQQILYTFSLSDIF